MCRKSRVNLILLPYSVKLTSFFLSIFKVYIEIEIREFRGSIFYRCVCTPSVCACAWAPNDKCT